MPFYEYQCSACAHRLEALQKISDDPLLYCPECGEASLKKMISAAAFRLKGSGWYETDFKNSGQNDSKPGKDDKKSDGKGAASETTIESNGSTGKGEGKSEKSSSSSNEPIKKSA